MIASRVASALEAVVRLESVAAPCVVVKQTPTRIPALYKPGPTSAALHSRTRPARRALMCKAVRTHVGSVVVNKGTKFAIVVARFNDLVTKLLLNGAVEALKRHGTDEVDIEVVWVPGSFELPVVAKTMAQTGKFGAVITLGAVVRGATTHYDAVVSGATSGVLGAGTDTGVPVIFGVLTCDDMEQALDRAGGKVGNKGYEAAVTAVEMANLMATLRSAGIAK